MSRSLLPVSLLALSLSLPLTAQPASHADLVVEAAPPAQLPISRQVYLWIGLRNQGPDAAENVVVTTASGEFLSTLGCLPDGSGKRCTINFLPAGNTVALGIDLARDLRPGRLQWQFEVTSDTPDPNPANNRIAGEIEITRAPAMTFRLYGNTADPGEPVEYTATIGNDSSIVAEDVSFTLPLPDGWSFERTLTEELRCEQTGREVRCTIDEIEPLGTVRSRFLLRAPNDTAGRVYQSTPVKLTTRHGVIDQYDRTTAFFATSIYRQITVTTTADSGEGSLRYAIALVNVDCTGHPNPQCKMAFDIPGSGTHRTIRPESPLPAISGIVFIDGSTQTRKHGDTNPEGPEIEINGSLLAAGNGFHVTGNSFAISDVVVNGFPENGLVFEKGQYGSVIRSYIGTDVTGRTAVPNGGRGIVANLSNTSYGAGLTLRDNVISGNARAGVFIGSLFQASIIGNRIGASAGESPQPLGNGASGIYVGPTIYTVVVQKNVIAFNGEAGVGITKGSGYVAVRGNSIHSNGTLGIDYNLDMVSTDATPFPVITSARYDESTGKTRIEGRIATSQYLGITDAELFANDAPGHEGHGEGELFLGRAPIINTAFVLDYPGDLRGRYITATATIANSYYPELPWLYTSEFSAALRVEGNASAPIDRAAAVPRGADLAVQIGFPYRIEAGVSQQGQVTVQNLGPEPTDEAVVEITSSNARLRDGYGSSKCAEIEGGLRCPLGTTERISFIIDAAIGVAKVDLKARVFSPLPDPDPLNNETRREIEVTGIPNLEVRIDSPGPVDPGEIATYTVRLFHRSAVEAHDLEVRIPVAHGWTLASSPTSRWSCAQEGGEIVCRAARMRGMSSDAFAIGVRAPRSEHALPRIDTTARLTARERQSPFNTNVVWELFHQIRVTSTADEGIGSLRDAIARSNRECGPVHHCKIVFAIDASAARNGVFTIQPRRPLGEIAGHDVIIDARTQTAHSGDTNPLGPEVELSGALVSGGNGFDVVSYGQGMIRGFAINGFPENGVWMRFQRSSWAPSGRHWVADNYIGTDPTGRIAVPNGGRGIVIQQNPESQVLLEIISNVISGNARAGIFIEGAQLVRIAQNRIGLSAGDAPSPLPNGASGIYLGRTSEVTIEDNEIAHNAHAGIATGRDATWTGIRRNATYDNGGLGVDHGIDSVTFNDDAGRTADLPRFPVILSAVWDASTRVTRIVGRAEGTRFNHQAVVELFANAQPDGSGYGEAQRSIGSVAIPASTSEQTFTFEIAEDLRGTFVTSTLTRFGDGTLRQWTSEIGQAVPVQ